VPYLVYERILKDEIDFPEDFDDEESIKIIKKLLNKCSEGRIVTSICEFKAHSWFKDIKWIDILNQKITAPFIPNLHDDQTNDCYANNQILADVIDEEMIKHFGSKRRFVAGMTLEIEKIWDDSRSSAGNIKSSKNFSKSTIDGVS
jgi:cGMP-dependent protein kinase